MKKCLFQMLTLLISSVFAFAPGKPTGNVPKMQTNLVARTADGFRCSWDMQRNVARWVFPEEAIILPTESQAMISAALDFIDEHRSIFGTNSSELVPKIATKRLDKFWLNLPQRHLGIPVVDGDVYFRIAGNGRIWAFGSRAITKFSQENRIPSISPNDAISSAITQLDYAIGRSNGNAPQLVWYPVNGMGVLSYKVFLNGEYPNRFECWVDAQTGELLGWTNLVNYYDLSGDIGIYYLPDFFDDPYDSAGCPFSRISLNYVQSTTADEDGHYYLDAWVGYVYQPIRTWLKGLWADVQRMSGGADAMITQYVTPPTTFDCYWTSSNALPDELNTYYHINYIHSYYKVLDPGMTGLDYPVPVRLRIPDTPENAYWDGYGTNFGAGGTSTRNFALFSNVIYHEYTHGVTGWIYRDGYLPYAGEQGAINEAFSDYFACTNTDYPYAGYRVPTDDTYFRDLDNDFVYPDDWYGEPHMDSRMISGAFWNIRQHLYPDRIGRADTIIHFSRYSEQAQFHDFAVECFFTADDDGDISNGCPQLGVIANSYARHGIGPGHFPYIYSADYEITDLGDGDGNLEPGEDAQITAKIIYFNPSSPVPTFLFPPLDSVYAYIVSSDEGIETVDEFSFVGAMNYGDTATATFTIHIADSVFPHYAQLSVVEGAYDDDERYSNTCIDSIPITIGNPQVLLVDNSGETTLEAYYTAALKDIPVVYNVVEATDSTPSSATMAQYPAVIWFTGNAENSLSDENKTALGNYLDGGGKVLLTGQDGFDDVSYSSWLDDYFGGHISDDSLFVMAINGVSGDELGNDFNVVIFGAAGANNQQSPSALQSTAGTEFLRYNATGNPVAGIRYDSGSFRSVMLGFGLEAVYRSGIYIPLNEALAKILDWFGIEIFSDISENEQKPNVMRIFAYPNPFNSTIQFSVDGCNDDFSISIFDLRGNKIFSKMCSYKATVKWQPGNISTGIYLYKISAGEKNFNGKVIYIK